MDLVRNIKKICDNFVGLTKIVM